jgi:hypothetical protein
MDKETKFDFSLDKTLMRSPAKNKQNCLKRIYEKIARFNAPDYLHDVFISTKEKNITCPEL